MGYRLHYAKHYAPDWQGGYFGGTEFSEFENLYTDIFSDNGWCSEYEDMYELDRTDIENYVKEIRKSPELKNKYMTEYTNEEVAEIFDDILTSEDEIIRIEWF